MTKLSQDRRQRHRVRIDTPVRILPPGCGPPIVGEMQNLSDLGMFVRVDDGVCSVDAELVCDVCLPEPYETLPVRGRVVWVQDRPERGMGIEFLDLTGPDRHLLQRVGGGEPEPKPDAPADQGQDVKVWLETLTHPIRARVVRTGQGVLMSSPLPFLRLLSSVVVYPVDGGQGSFSGILDAVSLRQGEGTVPELQLHLSVQPEEPEIEEPGSEEPEPEGEEPEPIHIRSEHCAKVAGEFEVRRQATLEIVAEPPVQTDLRPDLLIVEKEPLSLESTQIDDESSWSLPEPDPSAHSHWSLSSDQVTKAIEAREGSRWRLWLAALAMIGITVGSMVYTDAWSRAWRWTQVQLDHLSARLALPAEASPEVPSPVIVPANASAPPLPAVKVETSVPSPPSSAAPIAPGKATPQRPPAPRRPHVMLAGSQRTLVVPVKGDTKDAVHYRLANPDGLVVNLPHARPRAAFGDYPMTEAPFRRIWLRRRDQGLHLRVLFNGKLPPYRLKIRGNEVRVLLDAED